MEFARKYSKWFERFCLSTVEEQGRRLLAFFPFANSVTKLTLDRKRVLRKTPDFKAKNRIRCWVDGADNLAKREKRTSTSISGRGP